MYRGFYYTVLMSAIGMFGFAFFFSACDLLDPSPKATITRPTELDCDNLTPLSGMEIYRCKCASCHGIDGEPATNQITNIRRFQSFSRFEASLNTGPKSMPEYPEIGVDERQRLFEYLRDTLGN